MMQTPEQRLAHLEQRVSVLDIFLRNALKQLEKEGWVPFGTNVNYPDRILEFSNDVLDEAGLPEFERVVK